MRKGTKASREAVFAACDAIMGEGKLPSTREVCARTGGSMSTISRHRREWGASLAATIAESPFAGLPDEISEFGRQLWQMALTEAQRQLDSAREDLRVEAERVDERVSAAQSEAERAAARSTALEHEVANARAQTALLNDDLSRRAREHDLVVSSLNTLIEDLKGRIATLCSDHAAEVSRMMADHERLLVQHAARQREIDRLRALLPSSS